MDNPPSLRRPALLQRLAAPARNAAWNLADESATSRRAQLEPIATTPAAPRFNVLGVGLSAVNLDEATGAIVSGQGRLRRGYVCVTELTGITEARNNPAFRGILNRAWLNLPGGPLAAIGRA
ncbi:MAG: hypothetical protein RIQ93_1914 [Verrucomicrobiota bacterium]